MNALGSMFLDVQKVAAAFRGSGAMAWGEHGSLAPEHRPI
jgi:hypothetical protein